MHASRLPLPFPVSAALSRPLPGFFVTTPARADGTALSLSVLEKYLLRLGAETVEFCDLKSALPMMRTALPNGRCLVYPDPRVLVPGQDRAEALHNVLKQAAAMLDRNPEGLGRDALEGFDRPLPDFACTLCGRCCQNMGDAWQGRVSPEEVAVWQAAGLGRILKFVQRVDRPGYSFFRAWVHPKTGQYLKKCPWLTQLGPGRRGCGIHAVRPLKCRAFPLFPHQAERAGCPGMARERDG